MDGVESGKEGGREEARSSECGVEGGGFPKIVKMESPIRFK